MQCLKFGFAASVITNLRLLTKLTSMQFLMFSKSFWWQSYSSTWRNHSWIQSLLLQRYLCWAQYISSTKTFLWNFCLCDSLHLQTLNKILLEVLIRNYVSLLIIQVWHKLFNPIHQQPLRGKWIVIMIIMKLFSIFKIHLEDARCWSPVVKISNPLKTSNRRRLRHCPCVQIMRIKISDGLILLACLDHDLHPYMDYLLSHIDLRSLKHLYFLY